MDLEQKVIKLLEQYGIDDQRTAAWHLKRGEMLTASEIWKCFGDSTPAARYELIMSKLSAPKQGDGPVVGALIWGTRFEPMAKEIYCSEEGVQIVDTTCVKHRDYEFIGASPDGIIRCSDERNGRLVEFKCPISRKFDSTTPIPLHYFHQMQLQMECTDLYECDYVEMQFKTMNYSEWMDSTAKYKSVFAVMSTGEVRYRSPVNDSRDSYTWTQEVCGDSDHQLIYWAIVNSRKQLVPRDPDWMPTHFPEMKATWDEVLEHRKAGTFPVSAKEKGILTI